MHFTCGHNVWSYLPFVLVEPRWVTRGYMYILVAVGDPDESFACLQMKRENGDMVRGWTSFLTSPKHSQTQTEVASFPLWTVPDNSWRFQTRCSDYPPLNLNRGARNFIRRCRFCQRCCAHPGSFLYSQLPRRCQWGRPAWSGQLGIAVLRRCAWKLKETW